MPRRLLEEVPAHRLDERARPLVAAPAGEGEDPHVRPVVRLGDDDVRREDLPRHDPPLARPPAGEEGGEATDDEEAPRLGGRGLARLAGLLQRPQRLPHGEAAHERRGQDAQVAPRAAEARHDARPRRRVAERRHPEHRLLDRGLAHVAAQREEQVAVAAVGALEAGAVEPVAVRGREGREPDAAGSDGGGGRLRLVEGQGHRLRQERRVAGHCGEALDLVLGDRPVEPRRPRRRAIARAAPDREQAELAPGGGRELGLRVEEGPRGELRADGDEVRRVEARRAGEEREHFAEGLADDRRTRARRGPGGSRGAGAGAPRGAACRGARGRSPRRSPR